MTDRDPEDNRPDPESKELIEILGSFAGGTICMLIIGLVLERMIPPAKFSLVGYVFGSSWLLVMAIFSFRSDRSYRSRLWGVVRCGVLTGIVIVWTTHH